MVVKYFSGAECDIGHCMAVAAVRGQCLYIKGKHRNLLWSDSI
jgi:hypothetical protein